MKVHELITWYVCMTQQACTEYNRLNTVQRTALTKILSTFRTIATQALEVEAYIPPTPRQNDIANLCTLPKEHPIHNVIERTKWRCKLKWN
jgi:hypothetical protein